MNEDALISDPMADNVPEDTLERIHDNYEKAMRRIQELVHERDTAVQQRDEREDEFEGTREALIRAEEELVSLREENQALHRANRTLRRGNDRVMEFARDEQRRHRETRQALLNALRDDLEQPDPEDCLHDAAFSEPFGEY